MGVLQGCDSFLKYIFFFFTFIFWLLGVCSIGIGIWAAADSENFTEVLIKEIGVEIPGVDSSAITSAGAMLIVVGVIVMVVGFFGCCGAMKENQCLLALFFVCLLLTFVLMVAGAVMAGAFQNTLHKLINQGLGEIKDDFTNRREDIEKLQKAFNCCLYKANESHYDTCEEPSPKKSTAAPKPTTAAPKPTTAATNATKAPNAAPPAPNVDLNARAVGEHYSRDCGEAIIAKLNKYFAQYKVSIVGIGVASAVIVVIGMIVSMALCCKIRRGYANV